MRYLLFITKNGLVKKTPIEEYQNIRSSGLVAIRLDADDELLTVKPTLGQDEIMLVASNGKSIRFDESKIRPTGRATRGVTGIRLKKGEAVVGADVISQTAPQKLSSLLTVSRAGFGKKTPLVQYKKQGRGGMGIFTAKVTQKTGPLVVAKLLAASHEKQENEQELLITSKQGQVIRLKLFAVSELGRQTQGVKLIRLDEGDQVAAMALL